MAQVEFQYNGIIDIIQCNKDQKMEEICNNFLSKLNLNTNDIKYIYNGGEGKQFDKNMTFDEMANSFDKTRKKMTILVVNKNNLDKNNILIRSKRIICPECGEDIKIKKIENFKIDLFECKNNHKINNILINDFEKTQMINLKNIKCDICKEKNKSNTDNNEFYKCYECNINICPTCKLKHDAEHNIINYDKIHYICNKHDDKFVNYCNECKKNICLLCEIEHSTHDKQSISDRILDKKDIMNKLNELKMSKNILDENINKMIEILSKMKENMDNLYKLEEFIINNYNQEENNYEILYNIDKIMNYNNTIINNINQIDNEIDVSNKFKIINNIYNGINKNEIKLTIKIDKNDINKKIYFLDNTDGNIVARTELNEKSPFGLDFIEEEHHHDFLKELNESNTELFINNKKYKYEKYFIPEKEGEYNILLKFNILMNDCSFMFSGCSNIINIDFSSFNTQNVTNMCCMFYGCTNLAKIDFTSFNTKNVTDMSGMFYGCTSLTNIDLTSFNTENVINMYAMFYECTNVTNINLSSFNTENVINMCNMFSECSKLINIDLSSFNTKNVNNMSCMFYECTNLTNVNIPTFNTENVISMSFMFDGCPNLIKLDLSSFSTPKVSNMSGMFVGCTNLTNIDLSSFIIQNNTNMSGMFAECTKLKEIKIKQINGEKFKNEIDIKKIKYVK